MTTKLWWISVGGNKCEPARVVDKKTAYTIGCPDPIIIDDTIELVMEIEDQQIPLTDAQLERKRRRWERKVERDAKRGIYHGYRKFD
jgi:hypothetical protein